MSTTREQILAYITDDEIDKDVLEYLTETSIEYMILTAAKNVDEYEIDKYIKDMNIEKLLNRLRYHRVTTSIDIKTRRQIERYLKLIDKVIERSNEEIIIVNVFSDFKDYNKPINYPLLNLFDKYCFIENPQSKHSYNVKYNTIVHVNENDSENRKTYLFTVDDNIFAVYNKVYRRNKSLYETIVEKSKRDKSILYRYIFYDDLEAFKDKYNSIIDSKEIPHDLLDFAIQYDSINCAKYLLMLNAYEHGFSIINVYKTENYEMIRLFERVLNRELLSYEHRMIILNAINNANLELLSYIENNFDISKEIDKDIDSNPYCIYSLFDRRPLSIFMFKYCKRILCALYCEDETICKKIIESQKNKDEFLKDIEEIKKKGKIDVDIDAIENDVYSEVTRDSLYRFKNKDIYKITYK